MHLVPKGNTTPEDAQVVESLGDAKTQGRVFVAGGAGPAGDMGVVGAMLPDVLDGVRAEAGVGVDYNQQVTLCLAISCGDLGAAAWK